MEIEREWFHHFERHGIFPETYAERDIQVSWEGFLAGVEFERNCGALQTIVDLGFDYDGLTTVEDMKALIDDFVAMAKEGLKIKDLRRLVPLTIKVEGCDADTTITIETTSDRYEFIKEVGKLITDESTYPCMPTMTVEENEK
jgi:hypothetical protein